MKFPITRESLQAFDPVQDRKDKDDILAQQHIDHLVYRICQEMESYMSLPLPTNRVSEAIHISDARKAAHDKTLKEKRFVWNGLSNIKRTQHGPYLDASESVLIPLLITKLKETFIGCDIIIDPLKTYLIIDWS